MKKKYVVAISAITMALVFVTAVYVYKEQQRTAQAEIAKKHSATLIKSYSPRTGHPDAKVTIVEFMDPACETCRQFYPFVKQLLEKHAGKVNHVIRYAPFHQGSDYAIKILEAARKQNAYWPALELMFEAQPQWASHHHPQPELLWKYLEYYKFDVAFLKKEMNDPMIAKNIAQDLADAQRLGVSKTPSFFVNGKPLTHFGYQQLETLVNTAIAKHY